MKQKPTYDARCYDLAAFFLGDEPSLHDEEHIAELASLIQVTIEQHIDWLKRDAGDNK
jgi:hypothetical protein